MGRFTSSGLIFLSVVHKLCTDGAALHDHIRNMNVGPLNKGFSVLFIAAPSVRYTGTVDQFKNRKINRYL